MIYYAIRYAGKWIIDKCKEIGRSIARFFVWIVTARDCEHCHYKYITPIQIPSIRVRVDDCRLGFNRECQCLGSVTRIYFKKNR